MAAVQSSPRRRQYGGSLTFASATARADLPPSTLTPRLDGFHRSRDSGERRAQRRFASRRIRAPNDRHVPASARSVDDAAVAAFSTAAPSTASRS